ncbi:hypothetical protein DID80_08465 [Candidatus Marinamargulisbacteria bacterium SCGC AAA071-K20]|nr:hypothetical protein DID80_08465 [Candidatus Marinamargulisbacteria bacterium SCGC AAA071-K20]
MLKKRSGLTQTTKFKFKNPLYAIDTSVIDLCLSVFDWSKFRLGKGGIKLHCQFDLMTQIPAFNVITSAGAYVDFSLFQTYQDKGVFFVTRAKDNRRFEFLGQQDISRKKGLQFDHIVQIKNPK